MKAIALFSGGLDSMISMQLMNDQGIDVHAIFIETGFFGAVDNTRSILAKRAKMVGATFEVVNIQSEYMKETLFSPKYGYGKNFNPCIDCHAHMMRVAKRKMKEHDASFIITGEVVGQRPMSQRNEAMKNVLKLANEEKNTIVLRPLCAKLLEETKPEIEGWVDREKLLNINGRNRSIQLELAKKYNFEDFQSPGGGCMLTEVHFSKKLKNFIKAKPLDIQDVGILKVGRYLSINEKIKLIIGRDQDENIKIKEIINKNFIKIATVSVPGPSALLMATASKDEKELAMRIVLGYTKAKDGEVHTVEIDNEIYESTKIELSKEEMNKKWVLI